MKILLKYFDAQNEDESKALYTNIFAKGIFLLKFKFSLNFYAEETNCEFPS